MYDKNHCNVVISLQLIKINEKETILLLYGNKLDNLEWIDKFIEISNLSRLNQGGVDTLNRTITSSESEFVKKKKKNLPGNKSPVIASQGNSTKHVKTVIPGHLHSSFCEVTITLIPKPKTLQKCDVSDKYI